MNLSDMSRVQWVWNVFSDDPKVQSGKNKFCFSTSHLTLYSRGERRNSAAPFLLQEHQVQYCCELQSRNHFCRCALSQFWDLKTRDSLLQRKHKDKRTRVSHMHKRIPSERARDNVRPQRRQLQTGPIGLCSGFLVSVALAVITEVLGKIPRKNPPLLCNSWVFGPESLHGATGWKSELEHLLVLIIS